MSKERIEQEVREMESLGMKPKVVDGYLFFEIPLVPDGLPGCVLPEDWSIVRRPSNPPEVEKAVEEMRKRDEGKR